MEQNLYIFTQKLASKSPTPGGGGVAAICGAMGSALACMVCNLTVGKSKYKEYEKELVGILNEAERLRIWLMLLAEEDETAFEPLSKAYGLPIETDEEKAYKAETMETCLRTAAEVPFKTVKAAFEAIELHARLVDKASRLAISDVGAGAAVCKAALQSAALNVYINTKYMSDREFAERINRQTEETVKKGIKKADEVYEAVESMLK